jgi:transcription antitermination factor NusG
MQFCVKVSFAQGYVPEPFVAKGFFPPGSVSSILPPGHKESRSYSCVHFGVTSDCDSEGEALSTSNQTLQFPNAAPLTECNPVEHWYALQTRARHERIVKERLDKRGILTFLPTLIEVHRWSDRKKKVEMPLFSCYLFARLAPTRLDQLRVLCVEGVFRFVGPRREGLPIPDEQIEAVRALVESQLPCSSHPFLKIGQRVRIRSGSLDGLEGILVSRNGDTSVIISVDAIQRSLAVRVDGYEMEAA